ncbi:MAG TPA: hypothetical protein VD735_00375, partial [Candidatus Saccharimonadales bacterium]|nr:hypothetical protein [Candidatus Saccharimonadales bacterium]
SQYSKNLLLTPSLFVIHFDTSVPEGEGSGLYMQLEAKELHTSADIQCAQGIYDTSFFVHPPDHEPFRGVCPQRMYQAVVQRLWCNTSYERHGHYIDARRSLP